MTPKDNVYRLIQSLSSHERQGFTKASKGIKKEEPKYLKLFRALCELDRYEEADFLTSSKGKPFANGFSVQKKELFDRILHQLRSQRQSSGTEKPLEFQIREQVEDARHLREKKLYDLSRERLVHARKAAEEHEFHEILIEILRMERSVVVLEQEAGFVEKVRTLHGEIADLGAIILNKYRLMDLKDQLFLPTRQHALLHYRVDMAEMESVMDHDELKDIGLCLSFEAAWSYHFCHSTFRHLRGEAEQAWIHFRAIYLMWQEHKPVQRVRPVEYRNMLQNYLSLCNDAMRDEDFDVALNQLNQGPFQSKEEEIAAKTNSLNVRLQRHLNFCDWQAAKRLQDEYRKGMADMGDRMNPSRMMTFYLSFSRLCMVTDDYDGCLSWARKVVNEGEHDAKEGLVLQARIQELIALFEKKEWDKLETARNLAAKAINQVEAMTFEKEFIRWLAGKSKVVDESVIVKKLEKLLQLLQERRDRKRSADRMVEAWLRSKILGRKMSSLLEEERDAHLAKRLGGELEAVS